MRKFIAIIFTLCIAGGCRAQQYDSIYRYLTLDTILSYPSITISNCSYLRQSVYEDELVVTYHNSRLKSDTVSFLRINMSDYRSDSIHVVWPGLRDLMIQKNLSALSAVAYRKDFIVVSLGQDFVVYSLAVNGEYVETDYFAMPSDLGYGYAKMIDDSIMFFADNYLNNAHPVKIFTFNLHTHTLQHLREPKYNIPLLSYVRPFKYVDVSTNGIVFANRNEYSFQTYDRQLILQDTVIGDTLDWQPIPSSAVDSMLLLDDSEAGARSSIATAAWLKSHALNWVYMLDSTHVMCAIKLPKDRWYSYPYALMVIDIWEKTEEGWKKSKSSILDKGKLTNGKIGKDYFTLEFLSGTSVVVSGTKIITISGDGSVPNPIGLTPEQYYDKRERYYLENKPFLQIKFYKHSLCD